MGDKDQEGKRERGIERRSTTEIVRNSANSVKGYPSPERIAEIMRDAGLESVHWEPMAGGIIVLHSGIVTAPSAAETG